MSRNLHRQLQQARGVLRNHPVSMSQWCVEEKARQEEAVKTALPKVEAPARERVYHPAIKAPEHKCYRVVRRWKGEEYGDDIGYFRTEGEALDLLRLELGWAVVISPNYKRIAHNFQPMTEKPR